MCFIYLLNKHLSSRAYCVPGTVLRTGMRSVNKIDTNPTFAELMLCTGVQIVNIGESENPGASDEYNEKWLLVRRIVHG